MSHAASILFRCPNGDEDHDTDTPFVFPPSSFAPPAESGEEGGELGILAHSDATTSNRWEDGTVGVSQELRDILDESDMLPHCTECGAEVVPVE